MHPEDWHLLGVQWQGQVYLDTALPLGLQSAPKIFSALANGLLWAMACKGIKEGLHYLDDFLFGGKALTEECQIALSTALDTCAEAGVPVAMNKLEGPSTCIVFLGIEIDTKVGELRLPQEKLDRIIQELGLWSHSRSCTKRQLLSLIGVLQHASSVIPAGRPFLCRMIDLSKVASQLFHHIRLNQGFKSDLQWWLMFMCQWNGRRYFPMAQKQILLFSDASGSWGCGAYTGRSWFQLEWPSGSPSNIATKEMILILLAAMVWGRSWSTSQVTCFCDNEAVVAAINKNSARDASLMHILRCLSLFAAHFIFHQCHPPPGQGQHSG